MIFSQYELKGKIKKELDTEIRFLCASARVDGAELVYLYSDESEETKRFASSVRSVLGTMKREGLIQFYLSSEKLSEMTTEADFLTNKYGTYIAVCCDSKKGIFVKIQ